MSLPTLALVPPGEGIHHWLLGALVSQKVVAEQTAGALSIAEIAVPPGYAVPPHIHRDEDELFYVLDGVVEFVCDGESRTFDRGGLAWLPRGRVHTFTALGDEPARLFEFHTGPAFEGLLAEIGERAPEVRLPDPPDTEPDPVVVAAAFERHGIDLVVPGAG